MGWKRTLASAALACFCASFPARGDVLPDASIVRDGSIGPDASLQPVGPDYEITDTMGEFRGNGANLFHSFSFFGIGRGETATFSSSASPQRVIARVTGGYPSDIDGVLRCSIADADLFLLNPTGISFGQEAQLDVQGSFHASSADVLRFEDGDDFAVAEASPVLSAALPVAFGFTRANPGPISIARTQDLGVLEGNTFSLVGGDISMISTTGVGENIRAPGARVQIASAAGPVDIPLRLEDLDPGSLEPGTLGQIVVEAGSRVDVSTPSGEQTRAGEVLIRGERFVLTGGSQVIARHASADAPAVGGIDVAVTSAIEIDNDSRVISWSDGGGRAGDVSLRGDSITVSGAANVNTFATKAGEGGDVSLVAGSVSLIGGGKILSQGLDSGAGGAIAISADAIAVSSAAEIASRSDSSRAGGSIELMTGSLEVTDGGHVGSETGAGGAGGDLTISADRVLVSNQANNAQPTFIATNTTEDAAGDGGALRIEPRDDKVALVVELVDGGQIFARTEGAGRAGTLTIAAADRVHISGRDDQARPSGITSRALEHATPTEGGLLSIDTRVLTIEGGGQISSSTFGLGRAGNVWIEAAERVSVEGGDSLPSIVSAASIANATNPTEVGPGGNLEIHTGVLELKDGGQVTTSASGTGDAGALSIHADRIEVSGAADPAGFNPSGIFSRSNTEGVPKGGGGGDLTIEATESVSISEGGQVSVATTGSGNAGRLEIVAGDTLELASGGKISALSSGLGENAGNGGSITIKAGRGVHLDRGAEISARSLDRGLAGNISIDAGDRFESRGGSVTTEAEKSSGGKIAIKAGEIVYLLDSDVTTSVLQGAGGGGDISIDPRFVVLNRSQIKAQAIDGAGGNIHISADIYLASSDSLVSATSERGIDGEVEISAPATNLAGELATLPENFLDAAALQASRCAARTARAGSFVVARRGAMPAPPDAPLSAGDVDTLAAVGTPPPEMEECPQSEESR